MENIILTGASGFVGREILRRLEDEFNILALGRNWKFRTNHPHIRCLTGDLNEIDPQKLLRELPGQAADLFVHAAGQAHVSQISANRQLFVRNNIDATSSALRLARAAGVRKFILISSVVVYNDNDNDLYEQSKRESERLTVDYCLAHGISYTIVRPVLVYGEDAVVPYITELHRRMRRKYLLLPYGGRKPHYMIYVKNLAFIVRELIASGQYDNRILVAHDREIHTLKEICSVIRQTAGTSCLFVPVPSPIVKARIIAINLAKSIGMMPDAQARSLKNLNRDHEYPLDPPNRRLLDRLPFSQTEAVQQTLFDAQASQLRE